MNITKDIISHNIDNMDFMSNCSDNQYDWGIVDPNYGIGASRPSKKPNLVIQSNGKSLIVKNSPQYKHKNWDDKTPSLEYFKEITRITKNQIIWGVNYYNYPLIGGRLVWDKLNEKRIHPTQKPVLLYKWMLERYVLCGQSVFDSHSGSLSLAIACYLYGCKFEGTEKETDYWLDGIKRTQDFISRDKKSIF